METPGNPFESERRYEFSAHSWEAADLRIRTLPIRPPCPCAVDAWRAGWRIASQAPRREQRTGALFLFEADAVDLFVSMLGANHHALNLGGGNHDPVQLQARRDLGRGSMRMKVDSLLDRLGNITRHPSGHKISPLLGRGNRRRQTAPPCKSYTLIQLPANLPPDVLIANLAVCPVLAPRTRLRHRP